MEGKDLPSQTVLVTWRDAHSDVDGWISIADIDPEPCICHSVGFLLEDVKPDHVSLAQTHNDGRVDSVIHIPRAMVLEVENLELRNGPSAARPTPHRGLPEEGKSSWIPGTGRAGEADPDPGVLKNC